MELPKPYGGKLVNRIAPDSEFLSADGMQSISPSLDEIYDTEKICTGAYSPLEGFMGEEEYRRVITSDTLPNGLPWTMPIILAPSGENNAKTISGIGKSDEVLLLDQAHKPFAVLSLEEKFHFDKKEFAEKVYATTDPAHPNVGDIYNLGEFALGGKVRLIRKLDLPSKKFELSPSETRAEFQRRGWKSVAAYQARNPPHTAHEYIQRVTLERDDVDGLLVQPVVGKLKKGDYRPEIILEAYEAYVSKYFPSDRVMLASLSISMRYAGPKAVLFYAIVRRNYGCSHYIVGRDQAGVGNYYDPYAGHRIFDRFDVGVVPIRYQETFYCKTCGMMASTKTCSHPAEQHVSTSQTKIRKILSERGNLPTEILRPEVSKVLSKGDVLIT